MTLQHAEPGCGGGIALSQAGDGQMAGNEPCFRAACGYGAGMSSVQEIEAAIKQLSREEMRQVRDWLENVLEDQLEFTDEFKAKIEQSEREMAAGIRARVK